MGERGPIRTAGITPGPTQNPGDPDSLPRNRKEAE
jgi:cytochrome d ubiquinol oxidase subunit I